MKLKQCPRCEAIAYERIKHHGRESAYCICHDCNYNTVEFDEADRQVDRDIHFSRSERLDPMEEMDAVMKSTPPAFPFFSAIDSVVVRRALNELPETYKHALYLRHWKKFSDMSIAYFLNMRFRAVDKCIAQAYALLKKSCQQQESLKESPVSPLRQAA